MKDLAKSEVVYCVDTVKSSMLLIGVYRNSLIPGLVNYNSETRLCIKSDFIDKY